MSLIPVFQKCTTDYLSKKWKLNFPSPEWVEADINGEFYESNRYDVRLRDKEAGKTISVYLYMDEDSSEVLAIDEIVEDVKTHVRYRLEETPFAEILDDIFEQNRK